MTDAAAKINIRGCIDSAVPDCTKDLDRPL